MGMGLGWDWDGTGTEILTNGIEWDSKFFISNFQMNKILFYLQILSLS